MAAQIDFGTMFSRPRDTYPLNFSDGERAVELGHTKSDYARNVVALGEMKHQIAGLFEPVRREFPAVA
jgi:hypothetical protein